MQNHKICFEIYYSSIPSNHICKFDINVCNVGRRILKNVTISVGFSKIPHVNVFNLLFPAEDVL